MSLSPDASSWRTTPLTMRSMRSSWIGRLRSAMRIERASLSRSNGTRRPSDLHHGQLAQLHALDGGEALAAIAAEAAAADRAVVLGRAAVLHLGVVVAAERAAHGGSALRGRSGSARTAPARGRRPPARPRRWCRRWSGRARPAPRRSSGRPRGIPPAPKPRVVAAGEPRRTPEVIVGFSGSNGMAFLLAVMWARSRLASAALPVTRLGRRSTSIRWQSVPPVTIVEAAARSASRPAPWRCRRPPSGRRGTPAAAPRRRPPPCRR